MKNLFFQFLFAAAVGAITAATSCFGADLSGTIISEGEWNIKNGESDIVNQLNLKLSQELRKGTIFEVNILSQYNMRIDQNKFWNVAEDRQVFSNIALDDQLPVTLSEFGIKQEISQNFQAFVGVCNMNFDYFTSSVTGFFTNASDGIYPTIADNFSVANYPAAVLGMHLEWNFTPEITLKNSTYNGEASTRLDRQFRFAPKSDGIINVSEISYVGNEDSDKLLGEYHFGIVYANTQKEAANFEKKSQCSLFGLIEQPLRKGSLPVNLLLQYGCTPKKFNDTYEYFGVGILLANLLTETDQIGVMIHRSLYTDGTNETDTEASYQIPIIGKLTFKPAFHFIRYEEKNRVVGILRLIYEI